MDVSFVREATCLDFTEKFKLNVFHLKTYDMNYRELNIVSFYGYFSCFNRMVFHILKSIKNHLAYLNINEFLFLSY